MKYSVIVPVYNRPDEVDEVSSRNDCITERQPHEVKE